MNREPVVVDQSAVEWESWPAEQAARRGESEWKTLISAGLTESAGLTLGRQQVATWGSLRAHRHAQHEAYLVLAGTGVVTVDGAPRALLDSVAVFIPGNACHSVEATGESDLVIAYVLAADSFENVDYVFAD